MMLPSVSLLQNEIDSLGESLEPTHIMYEPELPDPVRTRILERGSRSGHTVVLEPTTSSRPDPRIENVPLERTVSEAVTHWNAMLLQDLTIRGLGAGAFLAEFRDICLAVLIEEPGYARVLISMEHSGRAIDWLRRR